MFRNVCIPFVLLTAASFLLTGCDQAEIKVYEVPKTEVDMVQPDMTPPFAPFAGNASADSSLPPTTMAEQQLPASSLNQDDDLTWDVPKHWQPGRASNMRKGSYQTGALDIAVTSFPGDVGGEAANVNRWRQQLGLPTLPDNEVAATVSDETSVSGLPLRVVELQNNGQATLAASLFYEGNSWFFKLTGPADQVEAERAAFTDWIRSTRAHSAE